MEMFAHSDKGVILALKNFFIFFLAKSITPSVGQQKKTLV